MGFLGTELHYRACLIKAWAIKLPSPNSKYFIIQLYSDVEFLQVLSDKMKSYWYRVEVNPI